MMDFEIRRYAEIDSTNTEARRLSQSGEREFLVIVAERQTSGKGRRGRTWESEEKGNLYFSLLLQPQMVPEKAPMLTLVMAYSVAKALFLLLEKYGLQDSIRNEAETLQIKWPNDVVIAGKKVCGILTEMHLCKDVCQPARAYIDDVIIGVGINVNGRIFSEELEDKATSLALAYDKVCDVEFDKEVLLQNILQEFGQQYVRFLEEQDVSFLREEYNALLVNCKKEVRVLSPGQEYNATAQGINDLGELLVQKEDGSVEAVYAGEVSVRGVYGYV